MKPLVGILGWLALLGTIAPSALYAAGVSLTLDQVKWAMLISTIVWFIVAPFWFSPASLDQDAQSKSQQQN